MSEVIAEITPTGDGERFGPRQQFFGESDDLREAVFKFSLGSRLPIGGRNPPADDARRTHPRHMRINEMIESAECEIALSWGLKKENPPEDLKAITEGHCCAGKINPEQLAPDARRIIADAMLRFVRRKAAKNHLGRFEVFWKNRETFGSPDEFPPRASVTDIRPASRQQFGV